MTDGLALFTSLSLSYSYLVNKHTIDTAQPCYRIFTKGLLWVIYMQGTLEVVETMKNQHEILQISNHSAKCISCSFVIC